MSDKPNKALFLDLDGTLITTKSGNTFPTGIDDWQWAFGNVLGRIHQYKARGFKLLVVTNQGGVDANFVTQEQIEAKFANIVRAMQRSGTTEDYVEVYACYLMKSYHRKPNPGMAYSAALEFELDLGSSIMVGDLDTDKEFAKRAGIGTFYYAHEFFRDPVRPELAPEPNPHRYE